SFIFCGPRIRYKPVDSLINEILEIKKRYNDIKTLRFIDDNLSFSKDWIKDFLTRIIDMKLPLKLEIQNFSVKHLDEEVLSLLIKAGMTTLTIAVETGSPEMQKRINKNLNFDMVRKLVKMIKSHGFHLHICWMVGFPNETLDQINETFNLARELKANSNQFVTVLPYPGTQLFDEAKRDNLLVFSEDDLDKFDNRRCDYIKSDQWNYNQLQKIIYDANIEINFLNNPSLETATGRDGLLEFFKPLLPALPEHIILHLIIGYIYKQKNCYSEYKKHYNIARELFKDKKLSETFSKYLSWDNPIIKDFNQFLNK
ncbi:MAG: radical SAM protein, partial [Patescibacteria group bacterium]